MTKEELEDIIQRNKKGVKKPKVKKNPIVANWIPIIEPPLRPIIQILHSKYPHITEKEIVTIVRYQFKFIADCIKAGDRTDFETFVNPLLNNLGTFYASAGNHFYTELNNGKKLLREQIQKLKESKENEQQ